MKYVIVVGISVTTMAISVLTAVSVALPAGPSDVDDTVGTLEADGYNVIVNRAGVTSLSGCTVTAVRPGPPTTTDTVYVDVAC